MKAPVSFDCQECGAEFVEVTRARASPAQFSEWEWETREEWRKRRQAIAAETFPVGHFIQEELQARGWTIPCRYLCEDCGWFGVTLEERKDDSGVVGCCPMCGGDDVEVYVLEQQGEKINN